MESILHRHDSFGGFSAFLWFEMKAYSTFRYLWLHFCVFLVHVCWMRFISDRSPEVNLVLVVFSLLWFEKGCLLFFVNPLKEISYVLAAIWKRVTLWWYRKLIWVMNIIWWIYMHVVLCVLKLNNKMPNEYLLLLVNLEWLWQYLWTFRKCSTVIKVLRSLYASQFAVIFHTYPLDNSIARNSLSPYADTRILKGCSLLDMLNFKVENHITLHHIFLYKRISVNLWPCFRFIWKC